MPSGACHASCGLLPAFGRRSPQYSAGRKGAAARRTKIKGERRSVSSAGAPQAAAAPCGGDWGVRTRIVVCGVRRAHPLGARCLCPTRFPSPPNVDGTGESTSALRVVGPRRRGGRSAVMPCRAHGSSSARAARGGKNLRARPTRRRRRCLTGFVAKASLRQAQAGLCRLCGNCTLRACVGC